MTKETSRLAYTIELVLFAALAAMMYSASDSARASVITDLPDDLGDALGISTNLAGAILSMGIIMSVVLLFAIAEFPLPGVIIVVILLMILLTLMSWLDAVFLIFTAIVTAIYFGITIRVLWGTPGA